MEPCDSDSLSSQLLPLRFYKNFHGLTHNRRGGLVIWRSLIISPPRLTIARTANTERRRQKQLGVAGDRVCPVSVAPTVSKVLWETAPKMVFVLGYVSFTRGNLRCEWWLKLHN